MFWRTLNRPLGIPWKIHLSLRDLPIKTAFAQISARHGRDYEELRGPLCCTSSRGIHGSCWRSPLFYDSYAITCSACSHIRVSQESLWTRLFYLQSVLSPWFLTKGPCLQLSSASLPASFKLCELMPAHGVRFSPQVSQKGEVKVENGTAGDTMLLTSWVRLYWVSVALQTPAGTASGKVFSAAEVPQPCCTEKGAGRSRSSHLSLALQCPWSTSAWSQLRTLRQDPELVFLNLTPVTFS